MAVIPDPVSSIIEQVTHVCDMVADCIADASESTPTDKERGGDDRLRTLLVGLEAARNAVEAAQAVAMVAMGREVQAVDAAERAESQMPTRSHEEFVPDEIAVLLGATKSTANLRYHAAWQATQYPAMAGAWRSGSIDARKVSVIAEEVQHLPAPAADELVTSAVE